MQPSSPTHPIPPARGPLLRRLTPPGGDGRQQRGLDPGRTLLGLAVLTVGVLYVLDALNVLDAGNAIDRWWPVAVIALGVSQIAISLIPGRRGSIVGPVVVTGAGVLLLLATTNVLEGDAWSYVWPVVIVGVGVTILLGRTRVGPPAGVAADDVVTATGIFSGPDVRTTSQQFRHASLTAVFGGVTLDLRDARLDPEGASVTATVVFGGIDILVPRGWRVTMRSTPVFGGMKDKTEPGAVLAADAPTLRVDGLALFGDVEVKHHK